MDLELAAVRDLLGIEADAATVQDLSAMDAPENMFTLLRLGITGGQRKVRSDQFPAVFDLK